MQLTKTIGGNTIEITATPSTYSLKVNGEYPRVNDYDLMDYGKGVKPSAYFAEKCLTPELKPLFDWGCAVLASQEFTDYRNKLSQDHRKSIAPEGEEFLALHYAGDSGSGLGKAHWRSDCSFFPFREKTKISMALAHKLIAMAKEQGCKYIDCYSSGYGYALTQAQYDQMLLAATTEARDAENQVSRQEIESLERELQNYSLTYATPQESEIARKRYNDGVNEGGDGYIPNSYYQDAQTHQELIARLAELKAEIAPHG